MSGFDSIVGGVELLQTKKERSKTFVYQKIHPLQKEEYENLGWSVSKVLKTRIEMKKDKPIDEQFEDQVWLLFYHLGFLFMNKDRHLEIQYSEVGRSSKKQIDVIAIDEETALVVECKSAISINKKASLKSEIEAIGGYKVGLIAEIRKHFPDVKVKFILATKNYLITEPDKERMKAFEICHFDEDNIRYYEELGEHLGSCARFQLLGNLFPGQKIANLENEVPAIEGRMGGQRYYSFTIEPERLLKIGYVLHRNNANTGLMPTYQRIIKKPRLFAVREFIEQGGYFPNSLVISIDSLGKGLRFDLSGLQAESAISRIGILHLPQTYRSAYIIDGQHRLYGYANTKYGKTNCIPVVAFVDLPKDQQIKLFMDINENQKSVSKNLRLTLQSDMFWESKSLSKRRTALRLYLAQQLGTDRASPLYNRVIVGENKKTDTCYITIDTIQSALNACDFLNRYSDKNEIRFDGTFDKGENDATYQLLFSFLVDCFDFFKECYPEDWACQDDKSSIILTNNGIWATIKTLNDIVNHIIETYKLNIKSEKEERIFNLVKPYLECLIKYFTGLSIEQKTELKRRYGSGGKTRCWHDFQKAISDLKPEFRPTTLDEYLKKQEMKYNEESFKMIRDIELYLKDDFRARLIAKYGDVWFAKGLPKSVYDNAMKLRADKTYEAIANGNAENFDAWDCMTLINYREIAILKPNWAELFSEKYTMPSERKRSGGREEKTEWMVRLNSIRNRNFHNYSVSEEEFEFIKSIYIWLLANN
ncbi:MAG: DGQHR domain-containing protein [Clostridiaceae bacterium]